MSSIKVDITGDVSTGAGMTSIRCLLDGASRALHTADGTTGLRPDDVEWLTEHVKQEHLALAQAGRVTFVRGQHWDF